MSKEAIKLALEALNSCTPEDTSTSHVIYAWHDEELVNKAIKALEEALAKQEQKEDFFKQIGDQSMMQLWQNYCDVKVERDELQEKLAKQEQGEPVAMPYAWVYVNKYGVDSVPASKEWCEVMVSGHGGSMFALYTTPQQRKPLTDEQILICARNGQHHHSDFRAGVQFAEAAHGIIQNYPEKDKK